MAQQMATKRDVQVRAKDRCTYCGTRLGTTLGLWGFFGRGTVTSAWDGTTWVPYHRVCWDQRRYERTRQ